MLAAEISPDSTQFLATLTAARIGEGGPELPAPVPTDPNWEPDYYWEEIDQGTFEPLTHPWGEVLGTDMSGVVFPGRAGVTLEWNEWTEKWELTVRSVWQMLTRGTAGMIDWMAPHLYIHPHPDTKPFLGYIKHEYDERPTLIWLTHHGFDFEGIEHSAE